MLGEIFVSRVIFQKPAWGSGMIVVMLAKSGEEVMISVQGTPDPVIFSDSDVMAFFEKLGFFSGSFDEVVLDVSDYRPAGFGFLRGRPEVTFAEIRRYGVAVDAPDVADDAPRELERSQFTTTMYTLSDDAFAQEEGAADDAAQEHPEPLESETPESMVGERFLTTLNLVRLTSVAVVLQLLVLLMMPPAVASMKAILYICAGSMVVVGLSFVLFERRNPDHASLRARRYLWLCLIVFGVTMSLSYVAGARLFG